MRKAKIEDGVVVNVEAVDPESIPVHAQSWPDCEKWVRKGCTYDGEAFHEPEPEPASADMIEDEAEHRVNMVASDRMQGRLTAERQALSVKAVLTAEEQARAAEIDDVFRAITATWAASDALIEAGCPADFKDDKHWP
ncbi:hypothetical protein [Roseovarius indicus]|uniref:hypothetical protein n=1 Tax=Roseovarius indicus TaxID=540747 RepID=UPI000B0440E9|nr:hypothetical protein [Roseovarius indicus]